MELAEVSESERCLWTPNATGIRIGLGGNKKSRENALAKMRVRGDGPDFVRVGGRIRYDPDAVLMMADLPLESNIQEVICPAAASQPMI